jgi:hypothetical protein
MLFEGKPKGYFSLHVCQNLPRPTYSIKWGETQRDKFSYSFINQVHYDMFRPVIAAIIEQCNSTVKGKN